MRRENIGARPSYALAVLDIDIPDEAFYHPSVVELGYIAAEILIIDNVSLPSPKINRMDSWCCLGPCFLQQGAGHGR